MAAAARVLRVLGRLGDLRDLEIRVVERGPYLVLEFRIAAFARWSKMTRPLWSMR